MHYITVGLLLLLAACAKPEEKKITIPERATTTAKPCPPGLPPICCKNMKSCA